jgi:hypothetical protein
MVSYIYNQKSENIDFKGLAEVINKLIFNNLHNPPPTKYFDTIINPLYSKQLLNRDHSPLLPFGDATVP